MNMVAVYFCIGCVVITIVGSIIMTIRGKIELAKEKKKNEQLKETYKEYEKQKNELKEKLNTGDSKSDIDNSVSILQDLANKSR